MSDYRILFANDWNIQNFDSLSGIISDKKQLLRLNSYKDLDPDLNMARNKLLSLVNECNDLLCVGDFCGCYDQISIIAKKSIVIGHKGCLHLEYDGPIHITSQNRVIHPISSCSFDSNEERYFISTTEEKNLQSSFYSWGLNSHITKEFYDQRDSDIISNEALAALRQAIAL